MWADAEPFAQWRRRFEHAGHTVNLITLPGHKEGESVDGMSMEIYISYVIHRIKMIGPCDVIGHSMGGLLAQAISFLKEVRSLVLTTSAAPYGIWPLSTELFLRIANPFRPYIASMFSGAGFRIADNDARRLMMNCLGSEFDPAELFPWKESGLAARQLAFGQVKVPQCEKPTLVLSGLRDRMTPPWVQQAIANMHGAELHEFEGGHMPMLEKCSGVVAEEILYWLDQG